MPGSEIFGWIIMGCGTVALIAAIDFIQRNLPDALDDSARNLSDSDRLASAFGDVPAVPLELRLPSKRGGERPVEAGEPIFNANDIQQNQTNSQSNSRSKFTGQGGL